jgi:hypothetical protein
MARKMSSKKMIMSEERQFAQLERMRAEEQAAGGQLDPQLRERMSKRLAVFTSDPRTSPADVERQMGYLPPKDKADG